MTNEKTVKDAARRMSEYLATKQTKVSHAQMLEALAVGFGLDNWRELKAVLDLPRMPKKATIPEGAMRRYIVDALYVENNQQYGTSVDARSPLEAGIWVCMERLTDFGLHVNILNAKTEDGPSESYSYPEDPLMAHFRAFIRLHLAVAKFTELTDEEQMAAIWLKELIENYIPLLDAPGLLKQDRIPSWETSLSDYSYVEDTLGCVVSDNNRIAFTITSLDAVGALKLLCNKVVGSFKNVVEMERADEKLACAIYQVEALVEYFPEAVNNELCMYEADESEQT